MNYPLRVVFFGTPHFSVPFLHACLEDKDINILAVVTQLDKSSGRGQELVSSPVKQITEAQHLPIFQPNSLKSSETMEFLTSLSADVFVVVAYGKMIPLEILALPSKGCVNVHPSLLPKYRGPSPLQASLLSGDKETGVTIMLLDKGMDTGPMLAQETVTLDSKETFLSLTKKIEAIAPNLLIQTLKKYASGLIVPVPQDETFASVTSLLEREDGRVDWRLPADVLDRRVRALNPWPGTWTIWNRHGKDIRLKILHTQPSQQPTDKNPGTVFTKNEHLYIATGSKTYLEILSIQPEGKKELSAAEFLRGYSDIVGSVL